MKRKSFAIGDRVIDNKSGKVGYITDVDVNAENRSIDYGINGAAWFKGVNIELLEDATDESLDIAFAMMWEE
jgi:hypothetical protein